MQIYFKLSISANQVLVFFLFPFSKKRKLVLRRILNVKGGISMAKPRPREQTYEFTDKPSYREWLIETVRAALPDGLELAASNYARSTASSYWLIKGYDDHDQVFWLTLRIATHRLWLQNAHQIEVL